MDVQTLPFDPYQRYRLVADLVGKLRTPGQTLQVLDVGGRTALLREFLPDDGVQLVDLEVSEERGLVLGDGSRLPFAAGAFDVVAAFDTLEHVPVDRREPFVAECLRVSRRWVFLAGPYKAPEVEEAESLLRGFLKQKLALEHRYLNEHHQHGLPDRGVVEAQMSAAGWRVASFGHGNLGRWLALMCMEMYMDDDPLLRPTAARFFRFYNRLLYPSDWAPPVYRHVVSATRGDGALPNVEGLLAPPVAPAGSLENIHDLALELLAFDREKDAWRPELARLEGIIREQQQNVEAHAEERLKILALLEETRGAARHAEQEFESARIEIERLVEKIRTRDQQIGALDAELRDRWKSVKRALSPPKRR
jgi:SAM-dependent methyltransferase